MKNFMTSAFAVLYMLMVALSCSDGRYHISPEGDDSASGTALRPLATLGGALERIREDRASGKVSGLAEIVFEEGEFNISGPVTFGPADTCIAVIGKGIGKSVISGGETLPAFSEENGIWVSDLSGRIVGKTDFQQLFVCGLPATLARTPDEDKFFMTGEVQETLLDRGLAVQRMKLSEEMLGALDDVDPGLTRVRVSFLHSWNLTRRYVYSIAEDDSLLYVTGNRMQPWNRLDRCSQCYFDNDRAFLNAPGEWFFDSDAQKLYYVPREGEEISSAVAVVPVTSNFIRILGTPDARAHDISFEGVSFKYCRYAMDWKGEDARQAAFSSEASLMVEFADNVNFRNCEIACAGNCGIWFRNSCRNSSLCGCYVHDVGIGGVKIGAHGSPEDADAQLTRFITVDNNIIRSGGRVLETGVGVALFHASDCSITHNDVSDFNYSGISVGWNWGYGHSPSKRNKINFNHIHHIGWGVLSDMGGVYTLGLSEGTEVNGNCIHDIYSFGYGGWGLYADEGSAGITMERNLVYNCKSSCFHQHYGRDNVIANNIFLNGLKAQLEATRVENHRSFTFCHNIICWTTGSLYGLHWDKVNFDSHENLYWKYGDSVSFNGRTLEEWQRSTGKDSGSIIADPGFVDIAAGNFTITARDIVSGIGFRSFDWKEAGVYGEDTWRSLAEIECHRNLRVLL